MTTTYWRPNAQANAQVKTVTITAVATGATLTATQNGKTIVYTCTASDSTTTAATNWTALLAASTVPPEFAEVAFTSATNVVTATALTAGTPFADLPGGSSSGMTFTAAGGATVTVATTAANSSPSDANNASNWLRAGVNSLPQNNDDLVFSDSNVPLLWNVDQLAGVMLNSLTRWQSMAGQIGLPPDNPAGYVEWRATYFKFSTVGGSSGLPFKATLGVGETGSGPPLEQYSAAGSVVAWTVLASGRASGDYAVRLLTGAGSTVYALNASVALANLPGESCSVQQVIADGGATLALGPQVAFTGSPPPGQPAVWVKGASAFLTCAPPSLSLDQGARVTVQGPGLTYQSVTAAGGSTVNWVSDSTVTNLTLQNASVFDRSADVRPMSVVSSTIDGDCVFNDPNGTITFVNPTTVRGAVQSGPFLVGANRTAKWA